jgi:hypothetical protein
VTGLKYRAGILAKDLVLASSLAVQYCHRTRPLNPGYSTKTTHLEVRESKFPRYPQGWTAMADIDMGSETEFQLATAVAL